MTDPVKLLPGYDLGMGLPEREKPDVFRPGKARCGVCGKPISDKDWRLFQTCDFWKCRAEQRRKQRGLRARREEAFRRRREEYARRVRLLRDEVAVSLGIAEPQQFVPLTVPAAQRAITRLPQDRLSAFGDHLRQLATDVLQDREEPAGHRPDGAALVPPAEEEENRDLILEQACATCRGYCCLSGENRAYIDMEEMSSYLAEHPQDEPPDAVSAFLAHVPESTCQDSCVYHGERGCGLPREMRSPVCNRFECAEIGWLRDELKGSAADRTFLAGTHGHRVVRYAFVEAGDVRRGSPPVTH